MTVMEGPLVTQTRILLASEETKRAAKVGFQFGWNAAVAHVARMLGQEHLRRLQVSTSASREAFEPMLKEHLAELGESIKRSYGL